MPDRHPESTDGRAGRGRAPEVPDLKGMTMADLEDLCASLGEPRYRASQLASWIFGKDESEFAAMTNLPASLRNRLAGEYTICRSRTIREERSEKDETRKLLLEYADGARIEAVILDDAGRKTGCISSQVGCRFGCVFCATGGMGLKRDLTAAEIVEEVQTVARAIRPERLENLVFMGMGEPLDNYDAVLKAVRILNAEWGLGIGARRITISTAGLVEGMRRLAGEGLQVNLAVSLNAARQELRERLMPVARLHPLPELVSAAREYCEKTGRMLTFEYVLLRGLNDSPEDASALAELAAGLPCKINLICYNRIDGDTLTPPTKDETKRFLSELRRTCPTVVRRKSRGDDISAGCGQLRVAAGGRADPRETGR
ncbi:MAG: 23S rRNA (adenine(2503)-C(2))-methyltransferase RlmN [Candidatus Eisenbacteria bacterium]|nr:23S rRNA (adenine(2503)-C(2))-methyltransferase RlmN [Candidatus Eisenbacteria bacterium]